MMFYFFQKRKGMFFSPVYWKEQMTQKTSHALFHFSREEASMGKYQDSCPHCSIHLHLEGDLRICAACGLAFNTVTGDQVHAPRIQYSKEMRDDDLRNRQQDICVEKSVFQQKCVEDFISGKMI